jgi:hypothetical protein
LNNIYVDYNFYCGDVVQYEQSTDFSMMFLQAFSYGKKNKKGRPETSLPKIVDIFHC